MENIKMKTLFAEKYPNEEYPMRRSFTSFAVSSALFALLSGAVPQTFSGNALAQIPSSQGTSAQNYIVQNNTVQNGTVQNTAAQINWQNGIAEAATQAKAQHKLIIVHFYGNNCPPCKTMDAEVYTDPRVIAGMNQLFIPVKVDTGQHSELVKQYDIKAIPTDLVIDENGKIIDKRQGGIGADRFCQYLDYLQKTAGKTAPQTAAIQQPAVIPQPAVPVPVAAAPDREQQVSPLAVQPVSQPVLNDPFLQQTAQQTAVQPAAIPQPAAVQPQVAQQVVQQPVQGQQFVPQTAQQPAAPQLSEVAKKQISSQIPVQNQNPMRTAETPVPAATEKAATPVPAVPAHTAAASPAVLPENCETVKPSMVELPLALDGYCPVVLTNEEKWTLGNPQLYAMFQGLVYHFSSEKAMQTFVENPLKYAPAMRGEDIVLLAERNKSSLGSRKFGAWFEGRVYLFSCQETLNVFAAKPEYYAVFAKQQETAQHTSSNTVQR
jgi:YHS domain-containing protein/thioredoxin-related protein